MPVAHHHAAVDPVDRAVGVADAGRPLAVAARIAPTVDQPVGPHPEAHPFPPQVGGNPVHLPGEDLSRVQPSAARTIRIGQIEHLVESGMEIRRSESLHDFVHTVEHDVMHFGMIRTITLAIETIRIGPDVIFGKFHPRLFIELRVNLQQLARPCRATTDGPAD